MLYLWDVSKRPLHHVVYLGTILGGVVSSWFWNVVTSVWLSASLAAFMALFLITCKSSSSQIEVFSGPLPYVSPAFAKNLVHHDFWASVITLELSRNLGMSRFRRSMSTLSGDEGTKVGGSLGMSWSYIEI